MNADCAGRLGQRSKEKEPSCQGVAGILPAGGTVPRFHFTRAGCSRHFGCDLDTTKRELAAKKPLPLWQAKFLTLVG